MKLYMIVITSISLTTFSNFTDLFIIPNLKLLRLTLKASELPRKLPSYTNCLGIYKDCSPPLFPKARWKLIINVSDVIG